MKRMSWILPILAVVFTISGIALTTYLTIKFRQNSIDSQETITKLNKEIDKSIKKVSSINEEILEVANHSDNLTIKIRKAQETISELTNEISEVSKANLNYTVGSEEPFMIEFIYDKFNHAFQIYASPRGELPVYDVDIFITDINLRANNFFEIVDSNLKNGKRSQIFGEMLRSFPTSNFVKKILLPNVPNFIGWIKNTNQENWKHFDLKVRTRTKIFEHEFFFITQ